MSHEKIGPNYAEKDESESIMEYFEALKMKIYFIFISRHYCCRWYILDQRST